MDPLLNNIQKEELLLPEIGSRLLSEDQIQRLQYILKPIFNGALDFKTLDKISLKLAGMLREQDITFESALELWAHLQTNIDILKNVYTYPKEHQTTLSFEEILYENGESVFDPKVIRDIEKKVDKILKLPRHHGMITCSMGTAVNMLIDPKRKQTFYEKISYTRKGEELSDEILVIDAYLDKLTVFDSPLGEEVRKFKAVFKTNLKNQPIITGPSTITEVYNFLVESGYIANTRHGKDINTMAINTFIKQGLAEVKTEIESPGFYNNPETEEIIAVKFEIKEIPTNQLKKALDLLKEFMEWFPNHETKLISIFKWGLISPFIFSMKQRGADVQWPYLYGRGGSGKTTMGKMVLYLWNKPDENNDIGGSGFNSEYRIGNRLQQSTFPIVVNEPGSIFENINTRDMLKTASQQTTSRGKQIGGRYTTIPAFAPVIFTSNQPLPSIGDDQEALIRRFFIQSFGYDEKKSKKEQEAFRRAFDIKNTKNCRLHGLKPLAQFASNEILTNPTLIDMDWKELADTLLLRICMDIGIEIPKWLDGWSEVESLDDFEDIQRERIRSFLQKEINQAYGQIQLIDNDGRPQKNYKDEINVKTTDDFQHRVWIVLNERKIPWAILDSQEKVHLTYGFVEALKKGTCIKDSMKTLGELLGWRIPKSGSRVRSVGFAGKSITVSRVNFTEFIFPTCTGEMCEG